MAEENDDGPVPVSALPEDAQEQVKEDLANQADNAPSLVGQQPLSPETEQAVADALANNVPPNIVPVLEHAAKAGACAFVDDLAVGIKSVDLGTASGIVNMLSGNIAGAIKTWIMTLGLPKPPVPGPTPAPYPPQPQPPYPYPAPAPYPPQPAPAPYYPPQPAPAPVPQPPQPYYPPQPQPQPAPVPPVPPRGPDINVR